MKFSSSSCCSTTSETRWVEMKKKPTKEQNDDVLYSFRLHTSQEFLLFIITIFLWWWKNYSAECHMWNFLGRFKIKETRRMKRRRSVKDLMQLIANFRMCDSTKLNEKQEISTACKVYTSLLIDDDLFLMVWLNYKEVFSLDFKYLCKYFY